MKAFVDKLTHHLIPILLTGILFALSFYYTARYDINALKGKTVSHDTQIMTLDKRMNEKDVQYKEIIIRQDYTIQMLEEIRNSMRENK